MAIEIRKLSPAVGAEVVGLDLTASVEPDTVDALEQAFVESGVLLFREQPLSAEQLVAFSRHFGALQVHVQRAYQHPEVPEVVMMTNRKPDGSFDEAGARRGAIEATRDGWHSDLSYDPIPAKATLLHALDVPSSGGNTCFCNATLAYDALSASLKARLHGLQAEFWYGGNSRNKKTMIAASTLDKTGKETAHAVHPVINAHPVTGMPGIYANPVITTGIVGVSDEESEELLEQLFDVMDQPEFRWEHEWSVGDTLMWENRGGTMHTGRLDYPRDEARRFIRTTVMGGPTAMYAA